MKRLVIAEKPSVARDIARVLGCKKQTKSSIEGNTYIVTWGLGHLVTLADPEDYNEDYKEWHIDDLPMMPEHMKLVVIKQTRAQFNAVKNLIHRNDVSEIIIATDAGREGELVARWILEKSGNKKPLKRLWISSVTDKAIKEGFANLKDAKEYEPLYEAAKARAQADWLVGMNATRALTCKYNAQLSCGRVQTPTLAMIAKREEEIKTFIPKSYYGLTARTNGTVFIWQDAKTNSSSSFDKKKIEEIEKKVKIEVGEIIDVKKTLKKTYPKGLYDLTTLQRDANQYFSFSAKQTLNIMQKLYEQYKVLTYPRTDSCYISADIVDTLKERVKAVSVGPYKQYAGTILKQPIKGNSSFVNDKKVSDHHAIIPTEQTPILSAFSNEERKIYDLVVRRFLAVLYPPYEYEQTTVTLKIADEIFIAKGKIEKKRGFLELIREGEDEIEGSLPEYKKGQRISDLMITKTEGKTKPPAYFTEATLLLAMENPVKYLEQKDKNTVKTLQETGGLGTVATRADIIEKLFNTYLMEKQGESIKITGKARQLLKLVPQDLRKPELTASWEAKLSLIAKGKMRQRDFLREIRKYTEDITKEIKMADGVFRHDNLTNKSCPNCGKKMLSVSNKTGKLFVCQDRECGYKERISKLTNARCPQCHKKMELIGTGEKQRFVCVCGHKESMHAFDERRKKEGKGVSKKDIAVYMKKQNQQQKEPLNSAFADALANLKLD
ncbi:MAG: DNA topoisomerase III [Lachnospiraceae bacterium]